MPTPTGSPIASVVDLPIGDLAVSQVPASIAVDDSSGDLFVLGRKGDGKAPPPPVVGSHPDGLFRIDPKTGASTQLAGLTNGRFGYLSGIAATKGWVFWVERDLSSLATSGLVRLDYLAMKADGTQRRVLAHFETKHPGQTSDPYIEDHGFSAGGGTAMWLEVTPKGRQVRLFDTATAKTFGVKNQPEVLSLGEVYGDRLLLITAEDLGYFMQLYTISTGRFDDLAYTYRGVLNATMYVGRDPDNTELTACAFTPPDDEYRCAERLEIQVKDWAALVCLVGTTAVGLSPGDGVSLEFVNVLEPKRRLRVANVRASEVGCGGKSVVYPWSGSVDENQRSEQRRYLRVITLD